MMKAAKRLSICLFGLALALSALVVIDVHEYLIQERLFTASAQSRLWHYKNNQIPKDLDLIYSCPGSTAVDGSSQPSTSQCFEDILPSIETIEAVALMAYLFQSIGHTKDSENLKVKILERIKSERENLLELRKAYFPELDLLVDAHNSSLILVSLYGKMEVNDFDWYADALDQAELQLVVPGLLHQQSLWRLGAYLRKPSSIKN